MAKYTELLRVRVSPSQVAKLEMASATSGQSISDLVRRGFTIVADEILREQQEARATDDSR